MGGGFWLQYLKWPPVLLLPCHIDRLVYNSCRASHPYLPRLCPLTARHLPLQVGGGGGGDAAGLDPVAGGEAGAATWLQQGSGSLTAAASAAAGQSHDTRQQDVSVAEPPITFPPSFLPPSLPLLSLSPPPSVRTPLSPS